jgi:hypothetical protein
MQYLWDETGKQYLDAFAGIVTVSVGHCHPAIVEKVRAQVGRLQHATTIYLHPAVAQLGKKLAEHMPKGSGLSVSYFTNSGSEANELAMLSAREFTGNAEVISLRNGYHGGTQGAMGLTAHGTWKFPTNPTINVKHGTPGYCYRCPFGLEYPSCDLKCARDQMRQLVGMRREPFAEPEHHPRPLDDRRFGPGRQRRGRCLHRAVDFLGPAQRHLGDDAPVRRVVDRAAAIRSTRLPASADQHLDLFTSDRRGVGWSHRAFSVRVSALHRSTDSTGTSRAYLPNRRPILCSGPSIGYPQCCDPNPSNDPPSEEPKCRESSEAP